MRYCLKLVVNFSCNNFFYRQMELNEILDGSLLHRLSAWACTLKLFTAVFHALGVKTSSTDIKMQDLS